MKIVAFDTETERFRPGCMAPPLVCITWQSPGEDAQIIHAKDPAAPALVRGWLTDKDVLLIGHHVVYDLAVLGAWRPEFVTLIFKAYDEDRIECTKIRQQLLDIAAGEFRGFNRKFRKEVLQDDGTVKVTEGQRWVQHDYDLASVGYRATGIRLKKEDTWRLRYGELKDVPIEKWPADAVSYPLDDTRMTLNVFLNQEEHSEYNEDRYRQARGAFGLHLTQIWGLKTCAKSVDELEKQCTEALVAIEEGLKEVGFVRKNGSRDTRKAQARMVEVCKAGGKVIPLTESGEKKLKEILETGGLTEKKRVNKQESEVFTPVPENNVYEFIAAKGGICLDNDACDGSEDDLLEDYAEFSSLQKMLSNEVPTLKQGVTYPIHTSYGLAASGRVTSSRPNVQNPKRSGAVYRNGKLKYTLPDVRECWLPRDGYVYAQADFSSLELHTLAQYCVSKFGESKLAEALNAGVDPHTDLAASILGMSYEEASARKKEALVDNARQTAKVCFHPDTEILTRVGWCPIGNINEETVIAVPRLAANTLDVSLSWEKPLRVTSRTAMELVHITNESVDLRVTPDHNMAGWTQNCYRDGRKVLVERSLKATETNRYRYFPNAGKLLDNGKNLPRQFVRMLVATQADGSYTTSGKIRFGFTKARKLKRFRWLFDGFYSEGVSSQGVTTFTVEGDLAKHILEHMPDKQLTKDMLSWDYVSRLTLVRETRYWDGSTAVNANKKWTRGRPAWNYCTTIKNNADVLTALAATVGYKSSVYLYKRHDKNPNYSDAYIVGIKMRCYARGGNVKVEREPYCGPVHCLTTSSGFVLVRSGGKTIITRQCNFGYPGGLGFKSLVYFARKQYHVNITEDRAHELKQQWLDHWPEMRLFFAYINDQVNKDTGEAVVQQLFSNRWRGGSSYCASCNTTFQGLGADAAKLALYLVQRACYAEPDSCLYGSRVVLMVHDELVGEVLNDSRAHDKAVEMSRLMCEGANKFLPDVHSKAPPLLATRWSKAAEAVYDAAGRLVPWTPEMKRDR